MSYQKMLHILEGLPMSVAYYLMSTIYTTSTLYILTILFDAAYCRILAIDPRFLLQKIKKSIICLLNLNAIAYSQYRALQSVVRVVLHCQHPTVSCATIYRKKFIFNDLYGPLPSSLKHCLRYRWYTEHGIFRQTVLGMNVELRRKHKNSVDVPDQVSNPCLHRMKRYQKHQVPRQQGSCICSISSYLQPANPHKSQRFHLNIPRLWAQ